MPGSSICGWRSSTDRAARRLLWKAGASSRSGLDSVPAGPHDELDPEGPMTQPDQDLVRAASAAFASGDLAALRGQFFAASWSTSPRPDRRAPLRRPAALLFMCERESPLKLIASGGLAAWRRKPWLAFTFVSRLREP